MVERLRLAALGGPYTFNAQAAKLMVERYPQFGELVFYPTSEEVVAAAARGEVDAACAPEQMSSSGFHAGMLARMTAPGAPLHVIAEVMRCYRCSLLGKPGASIPMVRQVFGHDGSIAHSRTWLEANLPGAVVTVVDTNSEVAAHTVLDGDGSIASIGSPDLAAAFGLLELASDIDDASAVNYWALSLDQHFPAAPTRVLLAGRFGDDPTLSEVITAMGGAGFAIRTACPVANPKRIHEYDYLLRFAGAGRIDDVRDVVRRFPAARLAGAWNWSD